MRNNNSLIFPNVGRIGLYFFLFIAALYFLIPLYLILVTSFKSMAEIRWANILSLPQEINFEYWQHAWSASCTGLDCQGLQVGFWNSVRILIPSVVISVLFGALNGYAMSFWRPKGANLLMIALICGAFIPYQVMLYPLVRITNTLNIYGSLTGIVTIHVIFSLPMTTLIFRNYYLTLPMELFKAARVDGAGFCRIFISIVLPLSVPIIAVATILQVTNIWNDFLLGMIFAGKENLPMTVQLNNIVNSQLSERTYNIDMAATLLTAAVPLAVYFLSGKYFVRGIASGAVKG
ncbi:carbohydrate ABC transporter permease [Simiduia curdlanivorans]|uniref:Carbohydrate ABC transporter permease n=1 Tax=Simiduia curdlanivorans TaxID=1492769 RepID=A0ABV8V203_9GAMM|nr:carbohydrate ABC transporter permease [Simiduia curdlanivorans]MDN3640143.1 carbohydrate ABC transporter permease [Simiduia curdlanivorans]